MEETVCPRRYSLVTVYPTRHYCAKRRLTCFHQAHLYRRRMRAECNIITLLFLDEKSILHIPGRMLGRKIQGREIVPVIFDFWSFSHNKAQFFKNLDDFLTY